MDYYSIWPVLIIVALLVMVFSLPMFARLDVASYSAKDRINNLDGLRFFLAIAVVLHHTSIRRVAAVTGIVSLPPSPFFAYLGSFGVAVFFMITAFLFWGRLIDKCGKIRWVELYTHRFFRIVPLYWALIVCYFAFVLIRAHFSIAVNPRMAIGQAWRWLAFGAYPLPPPFLGDAHSMSVVGMTWTLFYEWCFYISLPVLAFLAPYRYAGVAIASALLLILLDGALIPTPYRFYVCLFLVGMLVASAVRSFPKLQGDGWIRSVIALALLITAFNLGPEAYSVSGILLLGGFCGLIASGTSLFGLLRVSGSVRLGHASYSIYLIHGLVLSSLFLPGVLGLVANHSSLMFWCVAALTAFCVVLLSWVTHLLIERPGMSLGRTVYGRIMAPQVRPSKQDSASSRAV